MGAICTCDTLELPHSLNIFPRGHACEGPNLIVSWASCHVRHHPYLLCQSSTLHYLVSSIVPRHFVNKTYLLVTMLCTLCARLNFVFWDKLSLDDQNIARRYRSFIKHNKPSGSTVDACRYFVHQRSVSTLKKATEIGCHFCAILWHSLFELPPHCTDSEHFGIDWQSYQDQALVLRLELYQEGPWVEQLDSEWCDGRLWVFCADLKPVFLRLTKSLSSTYRQPGK